jgi:hypothetical protein
MGLSPCARFAGAGGGDEGGLMKGFWPWREPRADASVLVRREKPMCRGGGGGGGGGLRALSSDPPHALKNPPQFMIWLVCASASCRIPVRAVQRRAAAPKGRFQ